jgi:hypothetical protein
MLRRAASLGILLFAVFGMPRTSDAGLIEFIWELSGPQMIGGEYGCSFNLKWQLQTCRPGVSALTERRSSRFGPYIFLGVEGQVSTGKNSDDRPYEFLKNYRIAFTPAVSVQSGSLGKSHIYHSVGLTYDLLFGLARKEAPTTDSYSFDKFGFTITPIEFVFERFSVGAKVRIYPNGFTADEFGLGPRLDYDRPAEATLGVTATLRLW